MQYSTEIVAEPVSRLFSRWRVVWKSGGNCGSGGPRESEVDGRGVRLALRGSSPRGLILHYYGLLALYGAVLELGSCGRLFRVRR